jgi:hypothetical protein
MNEQLPSVQSEAATLMQVISRAATDPNVDAEKMTRLYDLAERIEIRRAKLAYSDAMNKTQAELRPVSQDAANPQTRSKYASYAALDNAIRPIYSRHGFAPSFDTEDGAPEGHVRVVCKVTHANGHEEKRHLDMPNDGKGAKGGDVMTKTHATMSAISYARRGLLKMVFNIAEGEYDDDGNGAGGSGPVSNITEEQVTILVTLITETKASLEKTLKFMGVENLAAIPASQFNKAKMALEARKK